MRKSDRVRLASQASRWSKARLSAVPYHRLWAFIREVTGHDATKAALFVSELALWTPRATFAVALNYAVTAHNSYELGTIADQVHTTVQTNRHTEARRSGRLPRFGRKAGEYARLLARKQR
jgi:hypothetical protein